MQLLFLGILGEYIGAIHSQVRRKPFVIVRETINFDEGARSPLAARRLQRRRRRAQRK